MARLLLNGRGEPYDKPTKNGNANMQIPNSFARLMKRIDADQHVISRLPFKMLRKTGGDLVSDSPRAKWPAYFRVTAAQWLPTTYPTFTRSVPSAKSSRH